jgi:hypothetical protein
MSFNESIIATAAPESGDSTGAGVGSWSELAAGGDESPPLLDGLVSEQATKTVNADAIPAIHRQVRMTESGLRVICAPE